jgi:exonuclease SbcD
MNYINSDKYSDEKFSTIKQAIEYAVENNIKYIVHSGDVFDRIRPNLQLLIKLMKILHTAEKKGVNFIIISGNHDQPKVKGIFNALGALESLDNVSVFIKPGIETVEDNGEKVDFICIPSPSEWNSFSDKFREILDETLLKSTSENKVLVTHIQIVNITDKATQEVEPFITNGISPQEIPQIFNYVALGHVHKMQQIAGRPEMYYAGSSSLLGFGDIGLKKYFIDVTIGKKTEIKPIEIKLTYDLVQVNVDLEKATSNQEIENTIKYYIDSKKIEGNIIKIILEHCTKTVFTVIDIPHITNIIKEKNPLGIKIEIKREGNLMIEADTPELNTEELSLSLIKPIDSEIQAYLKDQNIDELKIKEILTINDEVLNKVETEKEINNKED